jgi:uncharacterized protein (DUF433 family)
MPAANQLNWADCPAVERDSQRVSGAWVFRGTRIPVAEFVELFPGVSTDQAQQVLEQAWID